MPVDLPADEPADTPEVQQDPTQSEEFDPQADIPEPPSRPERPVLPKKTTTVQVSLDDTADDEPLVRRGQEGSTSYFPITIGSTYQGAIAIANAFSNGRGGTAASRATAYGSAKKEDSLGKKVASKKVDTLSH